MAHEEWYVLTENKTTYNFDTFYQIDNVVRLDNWLNFDMSARTAALVTALRPAIEKIVERAAAEPDSALNFSPKERKVSIQ